MARYRCENNNKKTEITILSVQQGGTSSAGEISKTINYTVEEKGEYIADAFGYAYPNSKCHCKINGEAATPVNYVANAAGHNCSYGLWKMDCKKGDVIQIYAYAKGHGEGGVVVRLAKIN